MYCRQVDQIGGQEEESSLLKLLGYEKSRCSEVGSPSSWPQHGLLQGSDTMVARDMEDLGVSKVPVGSHPQDLSCSISGHGSRQSETLQYSCPDTVQQSSSPASAQALGRSLCLCKTCSSCSDTATQGAWDLGVSRACYNTDFGVQVLPWMDSIPPNPLKAAQGCVCAIVYNTSISQLKI